MALIVEDGTGVTGANSYVSVADHVTYCATYGQTVTTQQAEINLRNAMDYIETQKYKGQKTDNADALQFPRQNLYVDNVLLPDDEIPAGLIKAQNECARSILSGVDPLAVQPRVTKEESFGPFKKVYMDNQPTTAENPRVDLFLEPYLLYVGGGISFKVITDKERVDGCCDGGVY